MLDADDAVIAAEAQRTDDLFPDERVVAPADRAEQPGSLAHPPVALHVEHAVDRDVVPVEGEILGVHVEYTVAQGADRRWHIHPLPEQVAGIEVDSDSRPGG